MATVRLSWDLRATDTTLPSLGTTLKIRLRHRQQFWTKYPNGSSSLDDDRSSSPPFCVLIPIPDVNVLALPLSCKIFFLSALPFMLPFPPWSFEVHTVATYLARFAVGEMVESRRRGCPGISMVVDFEFLQVFVDDVFKRAVEETCERLKREHSFVPNGGADMGVCAVCLEDMSGGATELIEMPCRHYFHQSCILAWLVKKLSCPLCRASV
ncbi:hypothetical protein SLA2020_047090 [Shorea laevis]